MKIPDGKLALPPRRFERDYIPTTAPTAPSNARVVGGLVTMNAEEQERLAKHRVRFFARQIRDEAHLEQILTDCDPKLRAEVRAMLVPHLKFEVGIDPFFLPTPASGDIDTESET